jgi:hypothetical protein
VTLNLALPPRPRDDPYVIVCCTSVPGLAASYTLTVTHNSPQLVEVLPYTANPSTSGYPPVKAVQKATKHGTLLPPSPLGPAGIAYAAAAPGAVFRATSAGDWPNLASRIRRLAREAAVVGAAAASGNGVAVNNGGGAARLSPAAAQATGAAPAAPPLWHIKSGSARDWRYVAQSSKAGSAAGSSSLAASPILSD